MIFHCKDGTLQLNEDLTLSPTMSKKEILSQKVIWEEWYPRVNGIAFNYKAVVNIKNTHSYEGVTVIINFNGESLEKSLLKSWLFAPSNKFSGLQKKPDGPTTKSLRKWFESKTDITLPAIGDWGEIDAAYDPHNQTAEIVCQYTQ
ncbi:TPA: hypothetical protein ACG0MY_000174 [Serratia marcescens]|uniref:hypothetical protein n=1 Tax=Serratia nevei TaxID=2703794 RepID=UPI00313CF2A3